jgi:hypothetical protein
LIRDYHFGVKRSKRIKDYHLKGCMVGQEYKPKTTEKNEFYPACYVTDEIGI